MSNEKTKKYEFYIQRLDQLPALPNIVFELSKKIDDPMSSIPQIEGIMQKDQGLTLKVLNVANSAYYAIPGGAKTLNRAITFLGMGTLKQIVLSAAVFEALGGRSNSSFDVIAFWKHSVGTAIAAQTLAQFVGFPPPDELFICGLVHDMGKMVINMIDPEEFARVAARAVAQKISYADAEAKLEAQKHTHWGQILALKWHLPLIIQSAVRDHHTSRPALRMSQDTDITTAVDIVYTSNCLMHRLGFSQGDYDIYTGLDSEITKRISLDEQKIEDLLKKMEKDLASVASFVEALGGRA